MPSFILKINKLTYKYVTYKYVTYKKVTYKYVTYKSITYYFVSSFKFVIFAEKNLWKHHLSLVRLPQKKILQTGNMRLKN